MANITLRCGASAAIIRTQGAQLISFHGNDGREVMWQADPKVWASHAPVLFPVIGFSKDGQASIDGVTYPMPKHGFARTPDFSVAKQGDDFVELTLTPTDESRSCYPFDFVFHVIFTLRENAINTQFLVENKSNKVMPFTVGGHPAFIVPMEEGASFSDYELVFPKQEDGRSLLVNGGLMDGYEVLPFEDGRRLTLHHEYFDTRDTLIFTDYNSRSVDLVHKVSGHGLRVSYPKMEVLAVWTMPHNHADYVCLEPWHGLPGFVNDSGRFEDKPFVTMLEPGMSHQCGFDVTLI